MADILINKKEKGGGGGHHSVFLLFQSFHNPSILPSPRKRLCQVWLKFTQDFFSKQDEKVYITDRPYI